MISNVALERRTSSGSWWLSAGKRWWTGEAVQSIGLNDHNGPDLARLGAETKVESGNIKASIPRRHKSSDRSSSSSVSLKYSIWVAPRHRDALRYSPSTIFLA